MTFELFDELPQEAFALVEQAKLTAEELQGKTNKKIESIRRKIDAEMAALQEQITELNTSLQGEQDKVYDQLIEELKPMQARYFREGQFEQALAIYAKVRELKRSAAKLEEDPGNLMNHREIGKTYKFEVIGASEGPLWGTDTYTADSSLAVAAVHAGALQPNQRGVVRVTMVDMSSMRVEGSVRNGVRSNPWDQYDIGFRVARG